MEQQIQTEVAAVNPVAEFFKKPGRGRPAVTVAQRVYRQQRNALAVRLAARADLRAYIGKHGIGMFGRMAQDNNAKLRENAAFVIGFMA